MEFSRSLLVSCVIVFSVTDAAKFPKTWKACKHDATLNECMKDSLQSVIPFLVESVPSLGLFTIDPMHFNHIAIGKGPGPVSLDMDFIDLDVTGLKDIKIESVETDWKTMKIEANVAKLDLKGKYKVDGKVLILPITGDGDCQLEIGGFKAHLYINYVEKQTGNKVYYNIEKMDFKFDADSFKLHLDNLFKGDKALGDQMNLFINENWKEILEELRPAIVKSFSMAFTEIGNRVFTKIPKDQITPP